MIYKKTINIVNIFSGQAVSISTNKKTSSLIA